MCLSLRATAKAPSNASSVAATSAATTPLARRPCRPAHAACASPGCSTVTRTVESSSVHAAGNSKSRAARILTHRRRSARAPGVEQAGHVDDLRGGGLQPCGVAVGQGQVAAARSASCKARAAPMSPAAPASTARPLAVRRAGHRRVAGPTGSSRFNAWSMSFPQGEQCLKDSLRAGLKALPETQRQRLAVEVQGFVGQETTHRCIHALFNGQLTRQGFDNWIERRSLRQLQADAHHDVRIRAAATAATEHFTALFADGLLRHPQVLAAARAPWPRLQTRAPACCAATCLAGASSSRRTFIPGARHWRAWRCVGEHRHVTEQAHHQGQSHYFSVCGGASV